MKRTVLFGGVLAAACSVFGAEVTFPSAGGDLATGWETAPDAGDTVVINQGGTYTLGADATFENVKVTTPKPVVFDFTAAPAKTITLNKKSTSMTWSAADSVYAFSPFKTTANLAFKGGVWDCAGNGHFYVCAPRMSAVATISDGAVITNVGNFYWGEHATGVKTVVDNARIHANRVGNWATGKYNLLVVTNGAQVCAADQFCTDMAGGPNETTGFNEIHVSGAGSHVEGKYVEVAYTHQGGVLDVTDGATLKATTHLKFGGNNGAASNGLCRVRNGAQADIAALYMGSGTAGASHARFECLNGASVRIGSLKMAAAGISPGCALIVSNADCVVTGSLSLATAATSPSNEIWVVDGGTLTGAAFDNAFYFDGSVGNVFGVRNAAVALSSSVCGRASSGADGNGFRVEDKGSLTFTGTSAGLTLGQGRMDNYLYVSNGYVEALNFYVGTGGSCNRFEVRHGHVNVRGSGGCVLGNSEGACSNRFEMTDGSVLSEPAGNQYAEIRIGNSGSWNEGLVADSCVTVGTVYVGFDAAAHHNKMTFRNTKLTLTGVSNDRIFFYKGHDNELTLDGTDCDLGASYARISNGGSNNVFRVVGGSTLTVPTRTTSVGVSSLYTANDEIYVGADSTLDLMRLRYMCVDSRLVISNGTVKIADRTNGLHLSYVENDGVPSSNNVLRLEGEAPRIESTGPIILTKGCRFEVSVPKKRYARGYVPVTARYITFDATSRIAVEGDDFFKWTGGKVVLAEVTESITLPKEAIAASLAEMPPECELYVEGKQLIFRAPNRQGTAVIVR